MSVVAEGRTELCTKQHVLWVAPGRFERPAHPRGIRPLAEMHTHLRCNMPLEEIA